MPAKKKATTARKVRPKKKSIPIRGTFNTFDPTCQTCFTVVDVGVTINPGETKRIKVKLTKLRDGRNKLTVG